MDKINFRFCNFNENLIYKVLSEESPNDTIFILPTESSKRFYQQAFQQRWCFTNTLFFTIEEFQLRCFYTDAPLLKEEKRTLAFYASLSNEHKKYFKINNYFQSIELAQNFFDLWEECNQELLDNDLSMLDHLELLHWQRQTYNQLSAIRENYKHYIHKKGFEDPIFLNIPKNIDFSWSKKFKRFVFVNQFYYTKLEIKLIENLSQVAKIIIYYQFPATKVDKKTLRIKDFTIKELGQHQTEKINITECPNTFSMMISLFSQIDSFQIKQVVDVGFQQHPYAYHFSPKHFQTSPGTHFSQSSIYLFLNTLYHLIDSTSREKTRNELLVPIQKILDAVLCQPFFYYCVDLLDIENPENIKTRILEYLYTLIEEDFKYIDLKGHFFNIIPYKDKACTDFVERILALINVFENVNTLKSFLECIDSPNGLQVLSIFSTQEKQCSDIQESFYRALSDFTSLVEFELVSDWQTFFKSSPENPLAIAGGFIRLFLDYLKPKSFKYNFDNSLKPYIKITELFDTRNIEYSKIAILNLSEGKIPTAKKTPFLFTEKQRKALGLKTFEDIKLWEKYYFFRLILTSSDVFLFNIKNAEKDIETSSFLDEIYLYLPNHKITKTTVNDIFYQPVFKTLFQSSTLIESPQKVNFNNFFFIPVEKDDFNGQLNMSFYSFKDLCKNPFVYYIKHISKLDERKTSIENDFSDKLIGNLFHDMLNFFWKKVLHNQGRSLDFNQIKNGIYSVNIKDLIKSNPRYYFKLPHDYTLKYFQEILLPIFYKSLEYFINFIRNEFGNKHLYIFPEKEQTGKKEPTVKILSHTENKLGINVEFSARADLRIENHDENKFGIFDYKTGRNDPYQLLSYELYYYIEKNPDLMNSVESYFVNLLKIEIENIYQARQKQISKEKLVQEFKDILIDKLNSIKKKGFYLPDNKTGLDILSDITRKDLYLTKRNQVEQSL